MNKNGLFKNYLPMFIFSLIGVCVNALLSKLILQTELAQSAFLNFGLSLLSFVLSFFFSLFIQIIAVHAYREGRSITVASMKDAFNKINWSRALWINFKVGLFVAIGTLFFVVPGIYLSLSYAFVGFIIYDFSTENDAPSRSWTLTQGYKLNILGAQFLATMLVALVSMLVVTITNSYDLGHAVENIGTFLLQPILINYFLELYIDSLDRHHIDFNHVNIDETVIIDV